MITPTHTDYLHENATYFGLSTDTKPLQHIGNGTAFIEIDSGKIYLFDAEHTEWIEWSPQ